MNYKVLYRKYRPTGFDSLIGQNAVVQILKNSIRENKIAHAYIFSGPRGTGKTSTARILAKSINCLHNQDGVACGECENCQHFSTSPDIIEIDAASNNGVDEIRELINNVKIMPTSLKYKIYIIDEVHMLSTSAFNALLLTLEEPPEHVIFILATTNLESVPITILSRCQKFDFKRINQKDIIARLRYVCEEEKISIEDDALTEIALLADGGMRDALSILDQLSKNEEKITLNLVVNEVGTISNKKISDLVDYLDKNEIDNVETTIKEVRNANLNYKVVIKKLIDILASRAVDNIKYGVVNHLTYDDYKNLIFELNELLNKINISIDPYVLIEILLLKYIDKKEIKNSSPVDVKVNNEVKEEPKVDLVREVPPQQISEDVKPKEIPRTPIQNDSLSNYNVDIRINNCFVDASKDMLNKVKNAWNDLIENADKAQLKGLISDTQPVASSAGYTIIATSINHKDQELNDNLAMLEKEFNQRYSFNLKLVFIEEKRWQEERNKYIENIKQNKKYTLKEEKQEEEKKEKAEEKKLGNNIEDVVKDIFNVNKIEII